MLFPAVSGAFVFLIGIFLAGGGAWLVKLGGSWYYLLAGLALMASGIMIARRRRAGLRLYAVVIAATLVWALWECGFDGWKLFPRLVAPAVLGFWLCLPWVAGRLEPAPRKAGGGWKSPPPPYPR